jgi:hypothetical protein
MEERGNKTIMCSVFFLDIVEYSKKSVAGQISLKERFNSYLSAAIRDVPMTDRIILDTGDGAAINFLGDVEDALKAALSLRESLLDEDPNVNPPLLVRMGINLGPVRLVRDINGQPNIVGDGINVAQRVMGFADAAQILVSRSYYDAVSRLSPQYAGMFHYQGSRTDKHVREHEVYAIGYPGDKTTHRGTSRPAITGSDGSPLARVLGSAKIIWRSAAAKLDVLIDLMIIRFNQADTKQRLLYIAVIAVPSLLFITLLADLIHQDVAPVAPPTKVKQAVNTVQPGSVIVPVQSVPGSLDVKSEGVNQARSATEPELNAKKNSEATDQREIHKSKHKDKPKHIEAQAKVDASNNAPVVTSNGKSGAYISVACVEGTEVFIDGIRKGRVGSSPLSLLLPPGKHAVIVSHSSRGIFTQNVELSLGKTLHIKPSLCN